MKDWKTDVLEICNTAYKGKLRIAKTKTDGSRRTVPVPPDMHDMLKRWILTQGLKPNNLLFPGRDKQSPLWPGVWMQRHLQRHAKQLGITVPVTFQVLRRSFATRHRNELKDAGGVMGHANYETTTANVYAQSVDAAVRKMIEDDERLFALDERKFTLMEEPVNGVQ